MNQVDCNIAVARRFLHEVVNGGYTEFLGERWRDDLTWAEGSMATLYGIDEFRAFNVASASGD